MASVMGFEYTSVLMASGAAGIALCSTLVMSWLRDRSSLFLLTWAVAIFLIILAIAGFLAFQSTVNILFCVSAGVLLTTAYVLEMAGLEQFRTGRLPLLRAAVAAAAFAAPIIMAASLGFDGLTFVLINVSGTIILAYNGYKYWSYRGDSPIPHGAIAFLHGVLAVSYALCTAVLLSESPLHLNGQAPSNWAEVLNLILSVVAITGIGGLFITIHQERISRQHHVASLTDPLTGLHNRRALFERFPDGTVGEGAGLVVFDLDDFKGHNDRHGHAFGDNVLHAFGKMLADHTRRDDLAVRLGGEEFVVLLKDSSPTDALALAERIRSAMGRMLHQHGNKSIICTVSAGVAVADKKGVSLDTLLRKADNALYISKRGGRNRVSQVTSTAA